MSVYQRFAVLRPNRWTALASVPLLLGALVAAAPPAATGSAAAPAARGERWEGSWAASAMSSSPLVSTVQALDNQTVRDIIHTSVGGSALRLRLSNAFGSAPVT